MPHPTVGLAVVVSVPLTVLQEVTLPRPWAQERRALHPLEQKVPAVVVLEQLLAVAPGHLSQAWQVHDMHKCTAAEYNCDSPFGGRIRDNLPILAGGRFNLALLLFPPHPLQTRTGTNFALPGFWFCKDKGKARRCRRFGYG